MLVFLGTKQKKTITSYLNSCYSLPENLNSILSQSAKLTPPSLFFFKPDPVFMEFLSPPRHPYHKPASVQIGTKIDRPRFFVAPERNLG
jgi:hypothetical protein